MAEVAARTKVDDAFVDEPWQRYQVIGSLAMVEPWQRRVIVSPTVPVEAWQRRRQSTVHVEPWQYRANTFL